MINSNTNFSCNEVEMVVNSLYKKNKTSFRYLREALKRQAMNISPFYRDFVLKVINNNALKIKQKWRGGYVTAAKEMIDTPTLSRRQANLVCADIRDTDVLFHELGHAVDFWFGDCQALSTSVIVSNNKTFKDIFNEEFEANHEAIYKELMNELKDIINSNINNSAYDILLNNMNLYNELCTLEDGSTDEIVIQRRKEILEQLYKSGFVDTYYLFQTKHCYNILNKKYRTILDVLSSKYDFESLSLYHHSKSYYQLSSNNVVYEFFAHLFNVKITSNHSESNYINHFFPKSFKAFEKLFYIFYDHIQNNKRFSDVKIKKEHIDNELQ